jgi:hypothetical protein
MMMRMLQAGGMPVITDAVRAADEHNPHGYFEDERVRSLAREAAWIEEARGKAIKVIYRLLPYLPSHLEYRVIYMQRDYLEIYDSQQAMLLSRGDAAAAQDRRSTLAALARDEDKVLRWLREQSNFRYLGVTYATAAGAVSEIARFLERELDQAAMLAAINPALYRHRRL